MIWDELLLSFVILGLHFGLFWSRGKLLAVKHDRIFTYKSKLLYKYIYIYINAFKSYKLLWKERQENKKIIQWKDWILSLHFIFMEQLKPGGGSKIWYLKEPLTTLQSLQFLRQSISLEYRQKWYNKIFGKSQLHCGSS